VREIVPALAARGVTFEHYDMDGLTREGDLHVAGGVALAWFKDPDGNIHVFWHSQGSQNDAKYANPDVDRLVDTARMVSGLEDRKRLYNEANRIYQKDGAIIYLYHQNNLFAMTSKLSGFQANPDGLIRIQGIKLQ